MLSARHAEHFCLFACLRCYAEKSLYRPKVFISIIFHLPFQMYNTAASPKARYTVCVNGKIYLPWRQCSFHRRLCHHSFCAFGASKVCKFALLQVHKLTVRSFSPASREKLRRLFFRMVLFSLVSAINRYCFSRT